MRTFLFISLFILTTCAFAQENEPRRRLFIPIQYAGSIGLFSTGMGVNFLKETLEFTVLYGFLPARTGGPIHTATLKAGYTPFHIKVNSRFSLTPLTAGIFFAQHYNENLTLLWDNKYPKGYYWWTRNFRQHIFLRTSMAVHPGMKTIDKCSLFLEMNTNDLYLYSYLPNTRAVKLHDILFFGVGMQIFLQ